MPLVLVLTMALGQLDDTSQAAATAAATVAMRDPAGVTALLVLGHRSHIWEAIAVNPEPAIEERAPIIDRGVLVGIEDKHPVPNFEQNFNEAMAYTYLLVQAHKTTLPALARSARRDLTYAHLWEEPEKFRGQVVHIEGRLRRLIRYDASRQAAKEGVPISYEGWIFGDNAFSNPYCVVLSELPPSITTGEKVEYRVAFDGYFFKLYGYKAGDGWRAAPLLIGKSLERLQAAAPEAEAGTYSLSSALVPGFLTLLAVTAFLGVSLSWWFRRGDRRVRSRLDRTRDDAFVEP